MVRFFRILNCFNKKIKLVAFFKDYKPEISANFYAL